MENFYSLNDFNYLKSKKSRKHKFSSQNKRKEMKMVKRKETNIIYPYILFVFV